MNPRHIDSLKISSLGNLDMGTAVTCVKIKPDATPPTNSLVSWSDGAFMFHLLPQHDVAAGITDEQPSSLQNEPEYQLIHEAGSCNAVWIIGNEVVCKIHAWKEGIQMESETIAFIREHFPDILVTEVVYEWVDKAINRSFLIMKRIRARTLEVAWPRLTHQQRLNIAKEVADYTATVASKTCDHLQTISGCGVDIPSLIQGYDFHGHIPH
jgi:hypothetical protein